MRILLDTHVAIWWQTNDPKLPKNLFIWYKHKPHVFVSQASLWEMSIKKSFGKINIDLSQFIRFTQQVGFEWLDISQQHILTVATLPIFSQHKDPFDRMPIAQAISDSLILFTVDQKLETYGEMFYSFKK
ncbi:type II toxin-antitoxin system VapC family toxin [Acinetobacter puyangensis]|uniref:type II toxin-antitoxin system VapC family toxin n=1 Tax=Acinetobacter puyangensis TaxID=1096779 RepID=UPI003A4D51DD